MWELCVFSIQCFCKPKTAPKMSTLKKKKVLEECIDLQML